MNYAGEHVIAALKAARIEKGLSQRALSQQAGVPQSHISKIEQGAVDIQLSSLIALARVLDLEVMPVPRKLVPAVQTVVRSGASELLRQAESSRQTLKYFKRIRKTAARLQTPENAGARSNLQKIAGELENFRLGPHELASVKEISEALEKTTAGPKALQAIQNAANELRRLRNALVHKQTEPPAVIRPAYALDEENA